MSAPSGSQDSWGSQICDVRASELMMSFAFAPYSGLSELAMLGCGFGYKNVVACSYPNS
jgi:hypothetical protein